MLIIITMIAETAPAAVADVTSEYLKQGVLGASVIALAVALIVLWRKNDSLQDKLEAAANQRVKEVQDVQQLRVADAQSVSAQLLRTVQESTTTLTNVANAMNAQRDALGEAREAMDRLAERVKR